MKKVLLFLGVILIGVFFVLGFNYYKGTFSNFQNDGYVIETKNSSKYYFQNNAEYKVYNTKDLVAFVDNEKKSKSISKASFIHYNDGSVSVFKDAAVVDLSKMDQKSFLYYTVHSGTVFTKAGLDFKVSYLEKQLSFSKFIIKISANKYLVASPTLSVKVGDNEQNVKSGYIELTYFDGNIVKLQNQEIDIQNISSDITINLDTDTVIKVSKKRIYYKDVFKINLGEITIASNDNIEIVKDVNNTRIDKGTKTNQTIVDNNNNNNNNNSNGNNGNGSDNTSTDTKAQSGLNNNSQSSDTEEEEQKVNVVYHQGAFDTVTSGNVDAAEIETTRVVENNAAVKDAEFTITKFDVTANSVSATAEVVDTEAVLTGDLKIKIINAASNEVVYYSQDTSGSNTINVEVATLKPDTNYILIMNRDYEKNSVPYNKDFIQKTFVTSPLGVTVEKEYVKSDEAKFVVKRSSYSRTESVSYQLFDNTIKMDITPYDNVIDFSTDDTNLRELIFDGLAPNHEYNIRFFDFVYVNTKIDSSDSNYNQTFKTLKKRPNIGNTSYSIDKKDSRFIIYLNDMFDSYGGINSYRVDVYDSSTGELIVNKSSKPTSTIEFKIDGNLLKREVNYRAYIYLIFNDNEKEYEIPIGSEEIRVGGIEGPEVRWYPGDDTTFERIVGRVVIKERDVEHNKMINTDESIFVTYQNLSVGADPVTVIYRPGTDYTLVGDTIELNFDKNGMRKNDSYLFTVKAYVDYKDGNGHTLSDISQFIVHTLEPNNISTSNENLTGNSGNNNPFEVNIKLGPESASGNVNLESRTMKSVLVRFYSKIYNQDSPCTAENLCWEKRFYDLIDENTGKYFCESYQSKLKELFFDNYFNVKPATLDINPDDITYGEYYLVVTGAYDYTEYENELPIVSPPIPIRAKSTSGSVINKKVPLDIKKILNEEKTDELNVGTQVGFELTANITAPVRIKSITYNAYNYATGQRVFSKKEISTDGNIVSTIVPITTDRSNPDTTLLRGLNYNFDCVVEYYDLDGNEVDPETSVRSLVYDTNRQDSVLEIYQSNRTSSSITFKYTLKDTDGVIVGSRLKYYKDNSTENAYDITLSPANVDSPNSFVIPRSNFGGGTLHGYVEKRYNESESSERIDVIDYYFTEGLITNLGNVYFSISEGLNKQVIKFIDLTTVQESNIVGADVILSALGHGDTFLKNLSIEKGNVINIDYRDITHLLGKEIGLDVKLYYDTGVYGIDAEQQGNNGYALQRRSDRSYITFVDENDSSIRSFANKINHDFVNKHINATSLDNTLNKEFDYTLANGFFVNPDSEPFSVKVLNTTMGRCSGSCKFQFNEIKPTMSIKSEQGFVTTFDLDATVSGIDRADEESFQIVAKKWLCNNEGCTSKQYLEGKDSVWSLEEFNSAVTTIRNLDISSTYRVYYYWKSAQFGDELKPFYYSTSDSYDYYSQFTTSNDVGLDEVYTSYNGDSVNHKREMQIHFKLNVLDGYNGIKFKIYYKDGPNDIEPFVIPEIPLNRLNNFLDGEEYVYPIDIYTDAEHRLLTKKVYYVDVEPYLAGSSNELKSEKGVKFNFLIPKPKITVSRISDIVDKKFDIRVFMKDSYNALADENHTTYDIYLDQGNGRTYLDSGEVGKTKTYWGVDCSNSAETCNIIIEYEADLLNTKTFNTEKETFTFNISNPISLGTSMIIASSDTSKIRVGFVDSYAITNINSVDYTIYDDQGNLLKSASNYKTVWGTSGAYLYFDLPAALDSPYVFENGKIYTIQMQLYSEDSMVGNVSLEYSKG